MSDALMPCPFCGSPAEMEFRIGGDGNILVHVGCSGNISGKCAVAPRIDYAEEWQAVKHWNRRMPDVRLAALESRIRFLSCEAVGAGFGTAEAQRLSYELAGLVCAREILTEAKP